MFFYELVCCWMHVQAKNKLMYIYTKSNSHKTTVTNEFISQYQPKDTLITSCSNFMMAQILLSAGPHLVVRLHCLRGLLTTPMFFMKLNHIMWYSYSNTGSHFIRWLRVRIITWHLLIIFPRNVNYWIWLRVVLIPCWFVMICCLNWMQIHLHYRYSPG